METNVWISAIQAGSVVLGAFIGALATIAGTVLKDYLENRKKSKIDSARGKLLKQTLERAKLDGWISIQTLAAIVGADLDTTRALLIEIGARGSMKPEKEMWSLISRNPLPGSPDDE